MSAIASMINFSQIQKRTKTVTFKKCRCSKIITSGDNEDYCGCGLEFEKHHPDTKYSYNQEMGRTGKWNYKTCTVDDGETDAFGRIIFPGASDVPSLYCRMSFRTQLEDVMKLLFSKNMWNLTPPKLIISVTGGATLNLKPRLKDSFRKGLVKAASTTNAWVSSGGTNNGCMKLVGEAFKENALSIDQNKKIIVLGIANFCTITNRDLLIKSDVKSRSNDLVEYPLVQRTKATSGPKKKEAFLDPNHSHFILVDNAFHEYGGEVEFRAALESLIASEAHLHMKEKHSGKKIPIVVLVIGGGPRTVEQILSSLENSSPCVILESSGSVSNIYTYALSKIKHELKEKQARSKDKKKEVQIEESGEFRLNENLHREISEMFVAEYKGTKTQEQINKMIESFVKSLNPKFAHLLTICHLVNDTADIDVAILKSLLKARGDAKKTHKNKEKTEEEIRATADMLNAQLELALTWNRVDIAQKFIFTEDLKTQLGPLDNLMYQAIIDNKHEFVKLFLENGFVLKNFVTYRRLLKFYNEVRSIGSIAKSSEHFLKSLIFRLLSEKIPKNSHLFMMLDKIHRNEKGNKHLLKKFQNDQANPVFTFKLIGKVIHSLVDDIYKDKFSLSPFNQISSSQAEKILKDTDDYGNPNPKTVGIFNGLDDQSELDVNNCSKLPEHELFMFSVLLGRPEMAKLFCIAGRNQLASLLIATKIFKKYAYNYDEDSTRYMDMATDFEKFACDLLDLGASQSESNTKNALARKIQEFNNCTCIQLAHASEDLDFISHQSFQNLLIKIWYGNILSDTGNIRLGLSILCPLLAPFLVDFKHKKVHKISKASDIEARPKDEEETHLDELDFEDDFNEIQEIDDEKTEGDENSTVITEVASKPNYLVCLWHFMRAPFVKFFYHQIFFLMFLILFSYVILCDFYPLSASGNPITRQGLAISIPEVILITWVLTFSIDEIREFNSNERKVLVAKVKTFISEFWNVIDDVAILLYLVALVLRFIPDYRCYQAARIILCIDIIFWYFKSLYAYTFLRNLGPKLYMIKEMLIKLLYFMLIVVMFIFAFGVSTQALMYHNQELNSKLLKNVFFPSYFVIGGEYYTRDTIMGADTCQVADTNRSITDQYSQDDCPDPVGADVSLALYVIYLIFLDILLVNLLIAIFNNTYETIEQEANKIWKSQRYALVHDYYNRPIIPPPFIMIDYAFLFFRFVLRFIYKRVKGTKLPSRRSNIFGRTLRFIIKKHSSGFECRFNGPQDEENLIKWETFITDELISNQEKASQEETTYILNENSKKLDTLSYKMEDISEEKDEEINKKIERLNNLMQQILKSIKDQ